MLIGGRETQQNCAEVLRILIDNRAAVDSVSGTEGLTVLHVAVQLGKAAEAGFLLSKVSASQSILILLCYPSVVFPLLSPSLTTS